MAFVLNMVALLLLSLGTGSGGPADAGVRGLVHDRELRALLLGGRLPDYDAAVESRLSRLLAGDLGRRLPRGHAVSEERVRRELRGGRRPEQAELLGAVKGALALATFVTELQALGPAQALRQAVNWVETGLVRRAGLRPEGFGSFYRILSDPGRHELDASDRSALQADLSAAQSNLDSGYRRLLGSLAESLF